jgi:hypothetical protein
MMLAICWDWVTRGCADGAPQVPAQGGELPGLVQGTLLCSSRRTAAFADPFLSSLPSCQSLTANGCQLHGLGTLPAQCILQCLCFAM